MKLDQQWFAARIVSSLEQRAVADLSAIGLRVHAPRRLVEVQHRRTKAWETREERLMPGYLLVQMPRQNECPSMRAINDCRGVIELLGFEAENGEHVPVPIPARVVEQLILAQVNMEFDDTRAAKIRRKEIGRTARETAVMQFPAGAVVTITDGPFRSFPGTVEGVDAHGVVSVLTKLFGRLTPVRLEAGQLQREAA